MIIFAIQFNFNANFSFDEGQSKIATWGNLFSQKMKSFCQQMKSPPDFSRRSQMDLRQCSASQTDRGTRKCQMARDNIVRGEKLHCARTEIGRGLAKKCPWRRLAAGRHLSRGCMGQLLILSLHDFFVAILSIRVRNRFRFILICEMRLIALECVSLRRQFDNYSDRWLSRQFVKLPWFRVFAVLDVSCLVDAFSFWQIQIHTKVTNAKCFWCSRGLLPGLRARPAPIQVSADQQRVWQDSGTENLSPDLYSWAFLSSAFIQSYIAAAGFAEDGRRWKSFILLQYDELCTNVQLLRDFVLLRLSFASMFN